MNIANQLTVLRILLTFLCMGFILKCDLYSLLAGLGVFVIASLTDFLDGHLARKKGKISDLGKILDPLADKILIIGTFLAFLEKGIVNSWLVIVIMIREFLITGLRLFALRQNKVIEARYLGKHKTVTQSAAIIVIFILVIIEKITLNLNAWGWFKDFRSMAIFLLMVWVAILTVISGIVYLWKNRTIIRSL
ncbi:MAG: CDP-diacylglycerol--glycerol-3-phosphate 3-phosphatidyltransferase [Candidatus Omnitrophica bacterium]|nr:CDP-diacylglycerol--glycerol-3-phosphate 3-phosphatidyltransferase [Candidatus Omnitrophota bacterium]